MKNLKIIMNGPLFFQLLVYAVFIAMNLLQFDEVNEYVTESQLTSEKAKKRSKRK